jgi:hypothetical protein
MAKEKSPGNTDTSEGVVNDLPSFEDTYMILSPDPYAI